MAIVFHCENCDAKFRVDTQHAHKRGKCGRCGKCQTVPGSRCGASPFQSSSSSSRRSQMSDRRVRRPSNPFVVGRKCFWLSVLALLFVAGCPLDERSFEVHDGAASSNSGARELAEPTGSLVEANPVGDRRASGDLRDNVLVPSGKADHLVLLDLTVRELSLELELREAKDLEQRAELQREIESLRTKRELFYQQTKGSEK